jgi:hypothetical protein
LALSSADRAADRAARPALSKPCSTLPIKSLRLSTWRASTIDFCRSVSSTCDGKEERVGDRPELADERRPEHQSRGDLADDGRLTGERGEAAAHLRGQDDDEQLDDEKRKRPAQGLGGRERRLRGVVHGGRARRGVPSRAQVEQGGDGGYRCRDDNRVDEDAPLHGGCAVV